MSSTPRSVAVSSTDSPKNYVKAAGGAISVPSFDPSLKGISSKAAGGAVSAPSYDPSLKGAYSKSAGGSAMKPSYDAHKERMGGIDRATFDQLIQTPRKSISPNNVMMRKCTFISPHNGEEITVACVFVGKPGC